MRSIRTLPVLRALFLAFCLAPALPVLAQNPPFSYAPADSNSGTFLFGSNTARHNQTLYPPGSITAPVGTPVQINTIYFRYGVPIGGVATTTLDSLTISLGETDSTQFQQVGINNLFFQTISPVLFRTRLTIPQGREGQWFALPLDQAYLYSPARTLIVDVKFANSSTATFGVRSASDFTRRGRAYADNLTAPSGSASSNLIPHFGMDFVVASAPALSRGGLAAYPQPGQGQISLHAMDASLVGKPYRCLDAAGRVVRAGTLGPITRLQGLGKGYYTIRAEGRTIKALVE